MVLVTRYAECPALPLLRLSGLCDSCWNTECCWSDTVWVSGSRPQEPPFPSSLLLQDSCHARSVKTLRSPCCEKPKLHGGPEGWDAIKKEGVKISKVTGPGGWFHRHAQFVAVHWACPQLCPMEPGPAPGARVGWHGGGPPVTAGCCTYRTSTVCWRQGSAAPETWSSPESTPLCSLSACQRRTSRSSGRSRGPPPRVPHSPSSGVPRKSSWLCPTHPHPLNIPLVSVSVQGTWPSSQQWRQ